MAVIRGSQALAVKQLSVLIYGQSHVGKTSVAFSASRPFCLDFEWGAVRTEYRKDTSDVANAKGDRDWNVVWDDLTPQLPNIDTIIVDTTQAAMDLMFRALVEQNPKLENRIGPTMDGWGAQKKGMIEFYKRLMATGKDIIWIAHDMEDKDGEKILVRPNITGGFYKFLRQDIHYIGYLHKDEENKRMLDFTPMHQRVAKGESLGRIPVPHLAEKPNFMAELMKQMKENLGRVNSESAEVQALVQDWKDDIDTWTTPEDFTKRFATFQKLESPTKQMVAKHMKARRESLGIDYVVGEGFVWMPKPTAEV